LGVFSTHLLEEFPATRFAPSASSSSVPHPIAAPLHGCGGLLTRFHDYWEAPLWILGSGARLR
jgi:hypothetical protein